jgi:hypothetical protein
MPPKAKASDVFTELEIAELQEAVKDRESDLKRERTRCENRGLDGAVQEISDRLKVLSGDGPLRPGLKSWLGVTEGDPDPAQKDIEEEIEENGQLEPDRATWDRTVDQVEELVGSILASDFPATAKLARVNRLILGEQERDKTRDGAMNHLRSARMVLEETLRNQAAAEGDEGEEATSG